MSERVFFTSDTHFSDERTLTLSRRPFATTQEMDVAMIERWNATVAPDDIVYHLGDFGNYEIAKQLHGKIRLLVGNYERDDLHGGKVTLVRLEELFDTVTLNDLVCLSLDEKYMTLVHEPSHRLSSAVRFHLFGHIHKLQMVKWNGLNVGVDCHDFTPVNFETVLFYKNAIEKHYDDEVFGA